ncbi:MAG: hypothetical protein Q9P01_22330 [Anaerolineae bacterium]|nr:hypothetical protein [Anaerolineae bacterium]MDQ7037475.1 hypothetical protein [Anaerolineae bacterium]
MQKPNAVKHMALYGSVYGWLLAMLFLWAGIIAGRFGIGEYSFFDNVGYSAGISVLIGALPGAVMGAMLGHTIRRIFGKLKLPIDALDFKEARKKAYRHVEVNTFLAMSLLVLASYLAFARSPSDVIFFSSPLLIGVLASLYTTNRYMVKFRAWAEFSKRKNEGKPKKLFADDDSLDDDYLLTTESDSQAHYTKRHQTK